MLLHSSRFKGTSVATYIHIGAYMPEHITLISSYSYPNLDLNAIGARQIKDLRDIDQHLEAHKLVEFRI